MTDLFEDLMRDVDPARGLAPLPAERREALLARAASPVDELGARRRPRWGRRLAAAAAVAAVTVGVYAVQATTGNVPAASAKEVLAKAALTTSDPATRPGQYWRISSTDEKIITTPGQGDGSLCVVAGSRVTYAAVDGSSPSWFVDAPERKVRQVRGAECGTLPAQSWTTNLIPNQQEASWAVPNPAWLAQLPRDVGALRARLYADRAGFGRGPDDEAFVYVADLLRSGQVPADLRAALFGVLQTIPGTTITDAHVTVGTRDGVAIGRLSTGERVELIFDSKQGDLLGERSTMLDHGVPIAQFSNVTRDVVDEVPSSVQRNAEKLTCTNPTMPDACH